MAGSDDSDNSGNKDDRLRDLEQRLSEAKNASAAGGAKNTRATMNNSQGIGFALRAGLELVVAMLVGFGVGYFLDGFFGVRPFLMILFGFLGLGAGVSNIYRLVNRFDMGVGYGRAGGEGGAGGDAGGDDGDAGGDAGGDDGDAGGDDGGAGGDSDSQKS